MKARHCEGTTQEEFDIPEEYRESAEAAREQLCEAVAEADDELMMKYLDGEPLTQEEVEGLLSKAIAKRLFVPVFVGSCTKELGVHSVMDDVATYFPSRSHGLRRDAARTATPSRLGRGRPPRGLRLQDLERSSAGAHQLPQGAHRHAHARHRAHQRAHPQGRAPGAPVCDVRPRADRGGQGRGRRHHRDHQDCRGHGRYALGLRQDRGGCLPVPQQPVPHRHRGREPLG